MKRISLFLCVFLSLVIVIGCSSEKESKTAEQYLNLLKNSGCPIDQILVYDESTDPNGNLGRPNHYISKADFSDKNLNQEDPNSLNGGTIEVFSSEDDCNSRYEYLNKFTDPKLGPIGLKQYMYKSKYSILRISYDITPTQAKVYEDAFYKITE